MLYIASVSIEALLRIFPVIGFGKFLSAEYMYVQMRNGLLSVLALINGYSESVFQSERRRKLANLANTTAEMHGVFRRHFGKQFAVFFEYRQ